MPWQDRVAYELVKPRRSLLTRPILWAISSVFVLWGSVVILAVLAGYVAAIRDSFL